MKKILFLTFIAISIIIPHKLYALDITIGATTWYAQSEQYYAQNKSAYFMNDTLVESNPAFLYGPTLAVRFSNDFNLTFVYLFGNFETVKDDGNFKYRSKYKRSDSDLALNYRLGDYFKVFLGMKYLSYDITPGDTDNQTFQIINIDPHTSYGAGLGLSATIPVTGDLFLLGTVSGLYLFGKDKVEITDYNSTANPRSVNLDYNEYGVNSTIALAYYIAPASTVISLGGRLQYLIADYKNNAIYLDSIKFTIYGVTLTATYTFSI
ncbi:MAG: hypothetical protein FWH53_05045 [Leptospirales bacterium]|nr:hypothetical protein [Leptospirales bacterium]